MNNNSEILEKYLDECSRQKRLSPKTICAYKIDLLLSDIIFKVKHKIYQLNALPLPVNFTSIFPHSNLLQLHSDFYRRSSKCFANIN